MDGERDVRGTRIGSQDRGGEDHGAAALRRHEPERHRLKVLVPPGATVLEETVVVVDADEHDRMAPDMPDWEWSSYKGGTIWVAHRHLFN
jgi:hypothetical protein